MGLSGQPNTWLRGRKKQTVLTNEQLEERWPHGRSSHMKSSSSFIYSPPIRRPSGLQFRPLMRQTDKNNPADFKLQLQAPRASHAHMTARLR